MGRQALEPANLDHDTETDQAVFAENRTQGAGSAGVTAVDRGNRGERGEQHGGHSRTVGQRKGGESYMKNGRLTRSVGSLSGPSSGGRQQAGGENQQRAEQGAGVRSLAPAQPGDDAGEDDGQVGEGPDQARGRQAIGL